MPERALEVAELNGKQKVAIADHRTGPGDLGQAAQADERGGDRGDHAGDRQLQEGRPGPAGGDPPRVLQPGRGAGVHHAGRSGLRARSILQAALGDNRADEIIGRLSSFLRVTPFDFLKHTDTKQLLSFIQDEHPQTIALIMCFLDRRRTRRRCSPGCRRKCRWTSRAAWPNMDRTSPEVIREVERVIEQKVSAVMTTEIAQSGGVKSLVEVLNRVDRARRRRSWRTWRTPTRSWPTRSSA